MELKKCLDKALFLKEGDFIKGKYKLYFSEHGENTVGISTRHHYCFMNSDGVYVLSKRAIPGFTLIPLDKDIFQNETRDWLTSSLIEAMVEEAEREPDTKKMTASLVRDYQAELDKALEEVSKNGWNKGGGADATTEADK